ncbi:MAG TPA: hypothetical protein VFT32_03985, partial [Candidatus Eisenbacteria bacterium]|nr:hypothetical protein [Candidatus Eisenbacteria bacterium]
MKRARVMATFLLAAAFGAAPPVRAADAEAPTHTAVFDSVAARVVDQLLPPGAIPPGRSLELATPLAGDTLGLLEQRLLARLKREGVAVRVAPAKTAAPGAPAAPAAPAFDPVTGEPLAPAAPETGGGSGASLRLEARVEAKTVSYLRRIGSFPFGTKGYERLVAVQVQSRLLDAATGEVVWARTGSDRATDLVRARDVQAVAASGAGLFR